jgi:hypothetical protein
MYEWTSSTQGYICMSGLHLLNEYVANTFPSRYIWPSLEVLYFFSLVLHFVEEHKLSC